MWKATRNAVAKIEAAGGTVVSELTPKGMQPLDTLDATSRAKVLGYKSKRATAAESFASFRCAMWCPSGACHGDARNCNRTRRSSVASAASVQLDDDHWEEIWKQSELLDARKEERDLTWFPSRAPDAAQTFSDDGSSHADDSA